MPFNIAEAALLLHVVGHLTGYKAKRLVVHTGDAHLYENSVEAAKEVISREPLALPQLEISPELLSFDDLNRLAFVRRKNHDDHLDTLLNLIMERLDNLNPNHFSIPDYVSHPPIKVDMAV